MQPLPPACGQEGAPKARKRSGRSKKHAAAAPARVSVEVLEHERTTLIFRNLPEGWTRVDFTALLEQHGFRGCFNFAHVPVNFQYMTNLGYALVNMVSHEEALRAMASFEGLPSSASQAFSVAWSLPNQGLRAHVDRYQNSPMMHESVLEKYKPALFQNGVQVAFPAPTKKLRSPRVRQAKGADSVESWE
jgi:hypothetical protein